MFDNGRIQSRDSLIFSHLTKEFFENRKDNFVCYGNPYKYKLWNNMEQQDRCYLTIEAYVDGFPKLMRITGSLRKWYFGAKSIEDLTVNDFIKALKLLSGYLEIPFKNLLEFNITRVEIGRNIRIKVPVSPFLGIVAGFSNSSYKLRQEKGWRHFRTEQFKVTLYDKIQ